MLVLANLWVYCIVVFMKKTPMMQQYEKIKSQNDGFLLFYRMGDFYELFGDDAAVAASVLNITLTKRRTSKEEDGVPMCGVPFHAAENYIGKLVANGHKVALCEQTEDPAEAKKKRGSKALVNREVVRLYTSGTLTEDSMLPEKSANHLVAVHTQDDTVALAWLDLSSGVFGVTSTTPAALPAELGRLQPKELLMDEDVFDTLKTQTDFHGHLDAVSHPFGDIFSSRNAERTLKQHLAVSTLDGFGFETPAQIAVCGAIVGYIAQTQKTEQATLPRPQVMRGQSAMHLDPATRTNLELTRTLAGTRKGSLLQTIDQTVTAPGARMLERWLTAPLTDLTAITARQDATAALIDTPQKRDDIRQRLKNLPDMGRALTRLSFGRGGPRDMGAIRQGLSLLPDLLEDIKTLGDAPLLADIQKDLSGFENLSKQLADALNDGDLPMLAREGGFIAEGFCAELDKYRNTNNAAFELLQKLEREEAEALGVSSLKVKYNKVWGYYIEITKTHADKAPDRYIHRQTTTQSQRFTTPELIEIEKDLASAGQRATARELTLYEDLRQLLCAQTESLLTCAAALATLDVLAASAALAAKEKLTRPTMTDSHAFNIEAGRHSVVEKTVDTFVPNNCALSGSDLWLVTGPNMAGKSTFLRQNALLAILAHAGFYVPAKKAEIGLIDRIFTRVGAADDLARGQSTFMVEMVEAANILNNATDKSLVILDEIGRGTATYDGLSIAWACVEHLARHIKCRALFATHYHELTTLEQTFKTVSNHHVAVKEWDEEIVFLHEVRKGSSPRSYGIHVGRLAGLPPSVTARAENILAGLEAQGATHQPETQMPLFSVNGPTHNVPTPETPLMDLLAQTNPDSLTPIKALELIYRMKDLSPNKNKRPKKKSTEDNNAASA